MPNNPENSNGQATRANPYGDAFRHNNVRQNLVQVDAVNEPSSDIEREGNFGWNEEINSLIQAVKSGEWEDNARSHRLAERYGEVESWWRTCKSFLGGEYDVCYDDAANTMRANTGNELLRRFLNPTWKTAKTAAFSAGIYAGIGILTGSAILATPAVMGVAAGGLAASYAWRLGVQAYEFITGKERGQREKIEIARIRLYQKAREIADRIPTALDPDLPAEDEAGNPLDEQGVLNYNRRRNQAIKDLVDFVHASEQNAVVFNRDEEGALNIASNQFGPPIPPRGTPGEPMAGGPTGPGLVTGTEVYQPSAVSPDTFTIDQLETDLQKRNKRVALTEEIGAIISGIAGSTGVKILEGSKLAHQIVDSMINTLQNGDQVRLDIDGNGVYHGVQAIGDNINGFLDNAKHFVYHYNDGGEAASAFLDQSQVLTGTVDSMKDMTHFADYYANASTLQTLGQIPDSEYGMHLLGNNGREVYSAIQGEAGKKLWEVLLSTYGGLLGRGAWGITSAIRGEKHSAKMRSDMRDQQEKLRHRRQPLEMQGQARETLVNMGRDIPEADQEWMIPDDENQPRLRIKIRQIDGPKGRVLIEDLPEDRNAHHFLRWIPMLEFRNYTRVEPRQAATSAAAGQPGEGSATPEQPEPTENTAGAPPAAPERREPPRPTVRVNTPYFPSVFDPAAPRVATQGEVDIRDGYIFVTQHDADPNNLQYHQVRINGQGQVTIQRLRTSKILNKTVLAPESISNAVNIDVQELEAWIQTNNIPDAANRSVNTWLMYSDGNRLIQELDSNQQGGNQGGGRQGGGGQKGKQGGRQGGGTH